MNIIYREESQISNTSKIIVGAFFILFAGWLLYAIVNAVMKPGTYLADIVIAGFALFLLLKRAAGHYEYIITNQDVRILERSYFGKREVVVPLADIDGICVMTKDIFRRIRFHRKLKLNSSLDNRKVWMFVYSLVDGKKMVHHRADIKVSERFLQELDNLVPGKVNITLNEVSFQALIREEAFRTGYTDPEAYRRDLKSGVLDED